MPAEHDAPRRREHAALTDPAVAEATVKNDPAVLDGLFKPELHPLYIDMIA